VKKKVAAAATVYHRHSHADVILGKILEGYHHDGGPGPNLQLVALYVDQFPDTDLSRALARKYGFRLTKTIEEALTLGTRGIAVDGVLSIGEHGDYPANARGQILYPRRRFFAEITKAFAKYKKSVPVFSDKHLAATWDDARWMYDQSRALFVPFMAGSSVPVMWRKPPLQLPKNCEIAEAVQLGYGPFEGYGFHALEGLQCMVERRRGGETGVKAVTCLTGAAQWQALDQGRWSRACLEAAMKIVPAHAQGDHRAITARTADAAVWRIEYRDGLTAAVAMMNGWMYEGDGGGFIFAGRLKGQDKPAATQFYQQLLDPMAHFEHQVKAIESFVRTGHAPYPVERTLLTTGILDAAMISYSEKGRRVETPHLAIKYQPTDWPFATDPVPKNVKR
jgi:hypothetical protein